MGGGHFDDQVYKSGRATRAKLNIPDFEHSQNAKNVHESLDPLRIHQKPFKRLESRDSEEHPVSTPIIVTFDVTGSNVYEASIVQKALPELMGKLKDICDNPQLAIWANDDVLQKGKNSIQLSDFESDNRIDTAIRNIWLTNDGGGNGAESYDLLIYAAARKTVTDSVEKRRRKGLMFLYADEPFRQFVDKGAVELVFDDNIEASIPIGDIVAEASQYWEIYILWPTSGYKVAYEQYQQLFDCDHVLISESPESLVDLIVDRTAQHLADQTSATAYQEDTISIDRE